MADSRIYLPDHADQARADAYSDGEAEDIAHDDAARNHGMGATLT